MNKTQDREDTNIIDSFLTTGNLPLRYYMQTGLRSIIQDPILTFIKYLEGPVGYQLRQYYYKSKMGHLGKNVLIEPDVSMSRYRNIFIDDYSRLAKGAQLYAPIGYIRIGKRCHVGNWILGHGGVEIGNCVGSGGMILSVTDTDVGGARMAGPMVPSEQRNLRYGKIIIEDDAFIGQYSIIMPGITIGEGAVVGPHSLVVKNVKPWTVVIGNPAREIGEREKVRFPKFK